MKAPKHFLSPGVETLRAQVAGPLLAWFASAQRAMPWRETRDPYAIWLSETMLQQTQVETVKPYYHKFLEQFPTVGELAGARLQEVLRLWAGLGYYRRARLFHAAAGEMVARHGGKVPGTAAQLLELPGVGRYTAGAVASIAFGERVAVLDGNVMRVLTRLLDLHEDLGLAQTQKRLWVIAEELVPEKRPGDYNQALMELGSLVCTPRNPQCLLCPLRPCCGAFLTGNQGHLPVKSTKKPGKTLKFVVLVLRGEAGALLVLQRPKGGMWEEMWEFPALKMIPQVNSLTQIADVVQQQLGLRVELEDWTRRLTHQLTHRRMEYRVYRGKVCGGTLGLPECEGGRYQAARWLAPGGLGELPVARVTRKVAQAAEVG